MAFRFLHAADIHLDSPLRGISEQEGPAADRIRTATREALDRLVTLAIDERVDFLIIAGDLYDGDWRDYKTGLFFAGQMGRLNQANIPVYLLHGNHDAESQITKRLEGRKESLVGPNVELDPRIDEGASAAGSTQQMVIRLSRWPCDSDSGHSRHS